MAASTSTRRGSTMRCSTPRWRRSRPTSATGLEVAIANVRAVAEAGLDDDRAVELAAGPDVALREVPVRRAAVYAPGGRHPYPSSVVMGVVTARAAGVDEVYLAASPNPTILAAARMCGADAVFQVTGAQAIAALAYGTESVPRVDVIVGPGSLWVQEAKRQVAHVVGIDGFAGPSDLTVIASDGRRHRSACRSTSTPRPSTARAR